MTNGKPESPKARFWREAMRLGDNPPDFLGRSQSIFIDPASGVEDPWLARQLGGLGFHITATRLPVGRGSYVQKKPFGFGDSGLYVFYSPTGATMIKTEEIRPGTDLSQRRKRISFKK